MRIQYKDDLRTAYCVLNGYKKLAALHGWNDNACQMVIDIKKSIREFLKRPSRRIVHSDGIDGFTELLELPEYIQTKDKATEYFENEVFIPAFHSQYDCTGRAFTSGYKIFQRRGRFHAYHSISYDV